MNYWSRRQHQASLFQSCLLFAKQQEWVGGILWNDSWHMPRWSLVWSRGVMSHAELLKQCRVTKVWSTLRWLTALLSVNASQAKLFHLWYSHSFILRRSLSPSFFSLLLWTDWCLVTWHRHRGCPSSTSQILPKSLIKHCSVSSFGPIMSQYQAADAAANLVGKVNVFKTQESFNRWTSYWQLLYFILPFDVLV